jgi:lambda repressor-like predicted transcriptional regulator
MSAKRIAMRKLREVLRLSYSAGLSIRKISASTKISVGSIQNILKLAVQLKITWPLPEDWDDQTLALKFYPRSDAQPSAKFQEPVWTNVHMELKKKGLTKQLLSGRNTLSSIRTVAIATHSSVPVMQAG